MKTNYKKTHEAVDAFPSFYETVSYAVGYLMFCPISFDLSPKIQVMLYFGRGRQLPSTALFS